MASATYSTLCEPIDLGQLLDVYGRDYETMFYYKDAKEDLADSLEREVLYWIAVSDAILLVVLLVVHQDYFFVQRVK